MRGHHHQPTSQLPGGSPGMRARTRTWSLQLTQQHTILLWHTNDICEKDYLCKLLLLIVIICYNNHCWFISLVSNLVTENLSIYQSAYHCPLHDQAIIVWFSFTRGVYHDTHQYLLSIMIWTIVKQLDHSDGMHCCPLCYKVNDCYLEISPTTTFTTISTLLPNLKSEFTETIKVADNIRMQPLTFQNGKHFIIFELVTVIKATHAFRGLLDNWKM